MRGNPSMTRAHFEFIATTLHSVEPSQTGPEWVQWFEVVQAFMRSLPATNGAFQADKFERFAVTGKY